MELNLFSPVLPMPPAEEIPRQIRAFPVY